MSETSSTTVVKFQEFTHGETAAIDMTWDFDTAVIQPPIANRRSVVSVAFPAADFQTVAREARRLGVKLSAYIREAALRAVEP